MAETLLRVGIDATGRLNLNHLWDIAVRGALLVELRLAGVTTETADDVDVSTDPTGVDYLDDAVRSLLSRPGETEVEWVERGDLKAAHVADHLVRAGEWKRHFDPIDSGGHVFRAPEHQQDELIQRLEHLVDDPHTEASAADTTVAAIGHTLNILCAGKRGPDASPSLILAGRLSPGLAAIVSAAVTQIHEIDANTRASAGASDEAIVFGGGL